MKAIVLDTKKESLEGEVILLLDPEKIASVAVERSVTGSECQKYGIRISGLGISHFFHITFSIASKMEAEKQKSLLLKLQARLAKASWGDSSPETTLLSEKLGL